MKYNKSLNANILAGSIISVAMLLRLFLVVLGWPAVNSDEGTMGLMGMHILLRGEHPIFFYGQNYMGTVEAYAAAILFHFFGLTTVTLRLGLLLMLTAFFISMYLLTKKLYSTQFSIFSLIILSLGSKFMLNKELAAVGGAVETLLIGSILFLFSTIITTESQVLPLFFFWGITAGLGIWSHLLTLPFILFALLSLIISTKKQLFSNKGVILILGCIIGSLPLIIYNLHAAPGQDSLSVFRQIHQEAGFPHPPLQQLLPLQMKGALFITLPIMTGASPICTMHDLVPTNLHLEKPFTCTLTQKFWPIGVITLWWYAIFQAIQQITKNKNKLQSTQKTRAINYIRLCLLLAVASTLFLYILSPAAALYPVTTSRYLIGLLIATPSLLWPLWNLKYSLRTISLGIITIIYLLGTINILSEISPLRQQTKTQFALIKILKQNNIHHIYSEYWICDRVIFQSKEQVICGVVNQLLGEGQNRYPSYYTTVTADKQSAYVFSVDYLHNNPITEEILSQKKYRKIATEGYIIYQPKSEN